MRCHGRRNCPASRRPSRRLHRNFPLQGRPLAAKFQKLCFYMDRCHVLIQDNGIVLFPVMVHRAEGNYNRMVSCNVLKRIGGNGTGRLAIHQDVRHPHSRGPLSW